MFNFFKKLPNYLKKDCTILHFHQQYINDQGFPTSISVFGAVTIVYLSHFDKCVGITHCGLISISLTSNDVKHLFMCLLATYISILVKCLVMPFVHF